MLRPTDNLRADHAVVSRGIAALQGLACHVRRGGAFPVADCARLLRFLREFVIAVHMRKEQEHVCPAVAMRGDEAVAALVGELARLHDEVRELTHALVLFWEPVGELSPEERAGFANTVDAVTSRARRMQQLEDTELYPTCDRVVPADDQLDWNRDWRQLEVERGGRSAWADEVHALADRWALPRRPCDGG